MLGQVLQLLDSAPGPETVGRLEIIQQRPELCFSANAVDMFRG